MTMIDFKLTLVYRVRMQFLGMDVQFFQVFPGGASDKEPTCQFRGYKRCGFNPWLGKTPGRENNEHPCLENPMDRGARRAIVRRVAKSWT